MPLTFEHIQCQTSNNVAVQLESNVTIVFLLFIAVYFCSSSHFPTALKWLNELSSIRNSLFCSQQAIISDLFGFIISLLSVVNSAAINGQYLSDSTAGNLSTLFDVGGVIGGILAGHISDHLDARAITAASFMYLAIPSLFLYRAYGTISLTWNIVLMLVTGMFVNGPYALITTAVSADLGTHSSLNGNSRALATVTAIIDGTGSVGAAIGPLLTGYISARSWTAVFMMLMVAALVAGLLLTRLVVAEATAKFESARAGRLSPAVADAAPEV